MEGVAIVIDSAKPTATEAPAERVFESRLRVVVVAPPECFVILMSKTVRGNCDEIVNGSSNRMFSKCLCELRTLFGYLRPALNSALPGARLCGNQPPFFEEAECYVFG